MKTKTNCTYAKLTNLTNEAQKETLDFFFKGVSEGAKSVKESNETLLEHVRMGDKDAITAMVRKNLAMVADIAVDLATDAADFLELFQNGIEGLYNAIRGFKTESNCKFTTYAYPIVKREMLERKQEQGSFCRIPQGAAQELRSIDRWIAAWQAEYQTNMTPSMEDIAFGTGLTIDRVYELMNLRRQTVDMDAPMGDEDDPDYCLRDNIEGDCFTDRLTSENEIRCIVEGVLSRVSARDAEVFRSLFGEYLDHDCKDANEIASELGCTPALVRMIKGKIVRAIAADPAMQSYLTVVAA